MTPSLYRAAKAATRASVGHLDSLDALDSLEDAVESYESEIRKRREKSEHEVPYVIDPEGEMSAKRKSTGVWEYMGPADEIEVWHSWFGFTPDGRDMLEDKDA